MLSFENDPSPTDTYTLSLHDALPICLKPNGWRKRSPSRICATSAWASCVTNTRLSWFLRDTSRSEEHTSELQSRGHLVCRLLLEKKKFFNIRFIYIRTLTTLNTEATI